MAMVTEYRKSTTQQFVAKIRLFNQIGWLPLLKFVTLF